ncbi:MAG TPA: FGGY family carbohydrate kinase [Planctomycetota bacterium]|nr:FGGY family carbohydrate kinase [Planctomycetota bacterium]
MSTVLALDLGTTRVKLGALRDDGALELLDAREAPPPRGAGSVREVDAAGYAALADGLLAEHGAPRGTRLGLASQRSSFLVWGVDDLAPRTPLVSWQDRRAAEWCAAHAQLAPRVLELTGLPLSPHYLGPKLAVLLAQRPELRAGLANGSLRVGTLETWRVARWGGPLETDFSMAARTLLVDVAAGDWSDELLELFGVPGNALARVVDTAPRAVELENGLLLAASLADQGSGLVAAVGDEDGAALVNLGTGAFVLRSTGSRFTPRAGYLAGPVARVAGVPRFALEGTVNGGGATADRIARGPTAIPDTDPAPDAYCLPDENGLGAPWWRSELGFTENDAARALAPAERRRVVLEGLAFRIAGHLDALASDVERVVLTGGLAREPFLRAALATLAPAPLFVVEEPEATLAGAARLAAGSRVPPPPAHACTEPPIAWLAPKRARWRAWVESLLA